MKTKSPLAWSLVFMLIVVAVAAAAVYWLGPARTSAIPADWQTYTDQTVGFTLRYPKSVLFNEETKNATVSVLNVSAQNISEIPEDLPMNRGRDSVLSDMKALQNGTLGETFDFVSDTPKIIALDGTYMKTYTVLAQFEVCSVLFVRTAIFYKNNYQVKVSLVGPKDKLVADSPQYFMADNANCSGERRWKENNTFIADLDAQKGPAMAQDWYNTFDKIIGTIQLTK